MPISTSELDEFSLPLPITQTARRTAQQFANEQPTPHKAEQVRLNTLAVYAVNDYLQMMGVPTNLEVSDSWNPVLRLCADVADLDVTGVGRLECRPHRLHQETCHIPAEVWSDRVGYVIVQIDESSLEATVLGFTQSVTTEELPIRQLQPIEDLIDLIHQPTPSGALATPTIAQPSRVNLSQWLLNAFETGWQTVESLLSPAEPEWAFRGAPDLAIADSELSAGGVRRAKPIDLGVQLAGYPVALIVELTPEPDGKTNILLQVHPTGNQTYLPPLLELTVLDESGAVFLEVEARSTDNYMQLEFSGFPGEQFSVKVALGDASVIEDFVV
jgi:hypothetical protein